MPNVSAGVGSESTCAGAGLGRGGAGTTTRSSSGGASQPTNAEAATGGAGVTPPHPGSILQLGFSHLWTFFYFYPNSGGYLKCGVFFRRFFLCLIFC